MSYSNYNKYESSNYGRFEPPPMSQEERNKRDQIYSLKRKIIQQYVNQYGLQKLQSDYFGMDEFYYDKKEKKLYKKRNDFGDHTTNYVIQFDPQQWLKGVSFDTLFEITHDNHIWEINGLL